MSRMRSIGVWSSSLLAVLLTLLLAAAFFVVGTESGSCKAVQMAFGYLRNSGIEISAVDSSGTLLRGLQLDSLQYRDAAANTELKIRMVNFNWQPRALLRKELIITSLEVEQVQWSAQSDPASDTSFTTDSIADWFALLPFSVQITQAKGTDIAIAIDENITLIPRIQFGGSVSTQQLELQDVDVEYSGVSVQGQISLQKDLHTSAQLLWSYSAAQNFSGQLELAGDLNTLQLEHRLLLPLQLHSAGELITGLSGTQALAISMQHDLATANLAGFGQPEIELRDVQLTTTGGLEQLALTASLNLQALDFAPAAVAFAARYTPERVELNSVTIDSEEISAAFTGGYGFSTNTLLLDWVLDRVTLERYLTGMEVSNVSGAGHLQLVTDSDGVDATLELGPLLGELNSYPLSILGSLQVRDSALTEINLTASNDTNSLQVNGPVAPELDLNWQLNAPRLQQVWTGLSGNVQGSGQLTGTLTEPLIKGQLQGQSLVLSMDDAIYSLSEFVADATSSTSSNTIQLHLQKLGMQSSGNYREVLQSADLRLVGTLQEQSLSVAMQGMDSNLQLNLAGSVDAGSWSGVLSSAQLQSPYGAWSLQEQAALFVGDNGFEISRQCWAMSNTQLCGQGKQTSATGLAASMNISALPLSWLNPQADSPDKPEALQYWQNAFGLNLPKGLQVLGSADISAQVSGLRGTQWQSLQASVQPQDLALQLVRQDENDLQTLAPEIRMFRFSDVDLRISSQNEIWRSNAAFVVTAGGSSSVLQGSFSADLSMDKNEMLDGRLTLDFGDLAWLETVLPDLQDTEGALRGTALVSGSRMVPLLDAVLTLQDGSFKLPDYGLYVHDINARLNSNSDKADLQLSAGSGDGELQLQASVLRPTEPEREVSAIITGQNFTLMATDAASISVSPDLNVGLTAKGLVLGGNLLIPFARLELDALLEDAATGAVSISRDVVVLEPDDESLVAQQSSTLPINARLTLKLGDEVSLSGFGLEATLNGELMLEQDEQRPLLAYGELGIPSGSYRFYNQELNARDGRLLFYGNPFNPVLDVKAYRETSTAEVGMMLSGSLKKIQGSLYSTPSLPENEILALLITGKSFNKMDEGDGNALISAIAGFGIERGEGITSKISDTLGLDNLAVNSGDSYLNSSLGLGKYLTPDLLMRYEIGLFDRQAVLSIEYTLTEHVKLEVKTGLSQSVDISYTIEKD